LAADGRWTARVVLGFFTAVAVVPVAWGFLYALAYSLGLVGLLSHGFTLEHWQRVLDAGELWRSVGYSLAIAAATVTLTVIFALAIALTFRRHARRGPLSYALHFPLALPPIVAALFVFQMLSGAGLVSRIAFRLGWISEIREFPALIYDRAGIGIILTHLALATPFFALLFAQLYENEKLADYTALSQTLGAGRWACLRRVVLPILLRRATANLTLFFIGVFGSFEIPLLLGPQAPQMISVLTQQKFALFDLSQKPAAYLIAVLYTALVLGLLFTVFRKRELAHVA